MTDKTWPRIARRIVQGLGIRPGELIQVRDAAGRLDVLLETSLAIELAGATPLLQLVPADYLQHLWTKAPQDYLANWVQYRQEWLEQTDRVLVLGSARPDLSLVPKAAFAAWRVATHRLTGIEEERRLPVLLVAIPTETRARQC